MHLVFRLAESAGNIIQKNVPNSVCQADCSYNGTGLPPAFGNAVDIILYLVGAIAILMLVVGGLRYVLSAGNPSAVNDAKNTILYSLVGIVVAVGAYAIVHFAAHKF